MDLDLLKALLKIDQRKEIYKNLLDFYKSLDNIKNISYKAFEISDGIVPVIYVGESLSSKKLKYVKLFIGAQHNEYNGLFGIKEFLEENIEDKILKDQLLIFLPLMNPYGFLKPNKYNKSGYYLKNGANLNRFWRHAFAPEHLQAKNDIKDYKEPKQVEILKSIVQKYWDKKDIGIYVLDFHETSLLYRFPKELSFDLTIYYKFDHWLKEAIVENILTLYEIPHYQKPLFYKFNPLADYTHINLSIKQIDLVLEKLREYLVNNRDRLAYYFCYSNKSKDYCFKLAGRVYNALKDKLWETKFPAYPHDYHDHGCFVKMSDATSREKVYTMELENQKQFFNLFEEIELCKNDPEYLNKKLQFFNISIDLVVRAIKEMIHLF
ncbi:MAG: hypothetical protein ACTSR8_08220 [Promethearchaeota archaeon]